MSNDEPCDHEWSFCDDSFDHEFGTEIVHYYECIYCGITKSVDDDEQEDYY